MTSTRLQVLLIYKKLLREGRNFTDYNFRTYALNKVRNEFRANKNVSDPARIKELLKEAGENLKMMERQVLIGQLYGDGKLVIESQPGQSSSLSSR